MTDITDIGESFWTTVWSDIKNGGTPFFIMLLLFVVWTCKKYIGDFLNLILEQLKLKTKNKSKTYTKKDVMNHPIFRDLEFWLSSGIDSIKMLNMIPNYSYVTEHIDSEDYLKAKEEIAKDLLRIKFKNIDKYLNDFIKEYDINELDLELLKKYVFQTLQVCRLNQQREMVEAGIPEKFLIKYLAFERIASDILTRGIDILLDPSSFDIDTPTRAYLIFNSIDHYMNEIFNNIVYTVQSINGDLNGIEYKGNIIGVKKAEIIKPPHPSFIKQANEKLDEIRSLYSASRAYTVRLYSDDNNIKKYSCVYEVCDNGIKEEIENLQGIPCTKESDLFDILMQGEVVSADISKFNDFISNRLTSRGVDAIIISPIFESEDLIGMLILDFVNVELYNRHKNDKDLDMKMKKYSEEIKPYITYLKDYKF